MSKDNFLILLIEEHVLLNRIQGNLKKETPIIKGQ